MAWSWWFGGRAAARFERLFREARRQFDLEMRAIFTRHAADGHLLSGMTLKAIVRSLDDATMAAISDALAGIGTVTDHAGAKRKRLLAELRASLAAHHELIQEAASERSERIGLGSDFKHAVPLMEAARGRHFERIADFAEGWTAPATKPWADRHPLLLATIAAVISGAVGIVIGWAGHALLE